MSETEPNHVPPSAVECPASTITSPLQTQKSNRSKFLNIHPNAEISPDSNILRGAKTAGNPACTSRTDAGIVFAKEVLPLVNYGRSEFPDRLDSERLRFLLVKRGKPRPPLLTTRSYPR